MLPERSSARRNSGRRTESPAGPEHATPPRPPARCRRAARIASPQRRTGLDGRGPTGAARPPSLLLAPARNGTCSLIESVSVSCAVSGSTGILLALAPDSSPQVASPRSRRDAHGPSVWLSSPLPSPRLPALQTRTSRRPRRIPRARSSPLASGDARRTIRADSARRARGPGRCASGDESVVIQGADHSVEIEGDTTGSIRAVEQVVRTMLRFLDL